LRNATQVVAFSSSRTSTQARRGVVDADVDVNELPAGGAAPVGASVGLAAPASGDPVAGAVGADPAELFDVDVDQLARHRALVAVRRLERLQARELAEPDPSQDALHRRERHPQALGDLGAGHPHPPQRGDRLDALRGGR
jgi:hypothetical protein